VFSIVTGLFWKSIFPELPETITEQIRMSSDDIPGEAEQKSIEEDRLSISIPPQTEFLPRTDSSFVVSFLFKQTVPPAFNRRQKLIAHYEAALPPYVGWAVAFRRFHSSYRFDFYLKDNAGSGGWFSFDVLDLKNDAWYALTFIIRPDEFISAYSVLLNDSHEPVLGLKKLGGFPLTTARDDSENVFFDKPLQSNLQITSGTPKIGPFRGRVEGITLLHLPALTSEKQFRKDAVKGPYGLLRTYPDACALTLLSDNPGARCKYSHP
jgi:hypothetical protein